MNRMIRGMAGLMVALGASACADDPSVEFGGDEPTKIQASPTVMFVNQGAREEILFRLVDDRNRSTPTSFEITNVGAGITVELDDEYRPDYIGSDELEFNPIQHQHRYYVTANEPVGTTFTVSSGGISQVITVNVVPTEIPITATVQDGIATITSETFTFGPTATVAFDGLSQSLISRSDDGHTITVAVPGGLTNIAPVISGAVAGYMPTIALGAAPGTATVSSTGSFGSATIANARTIQLNSDEITITDRGGTWGADILGDGGPLMWYKFEVPADRHLDITVDWVGGNDLDYELVRCDNLASILYVGTSAHPEHNSVDVTAGTYCLAVVDWNTAGAPTNWSIHIGP